MKKSISYYSSEKFKRKGLEVKIKDNTVIVTKGYLRLPNDKTAVLENDFKGKIKDDSQIIALMINLKTSKGKIMMLTNNIYDRMKYKLFEKLAWRNNLTKEWIAIKYMKTGSDLEKLSGGSTMKGVTFIIHQYIKS